ncbi:AMP-binding enzyme [Pseudonocardia lacus]|uniref:AMP-binding enzyme n=1 Tax=Pseudonocardia lacus TaxID=2835865 RepID=UPI001BDDB21A|nr:hypothetical protein [Pseudonocardia lacus]
MPSLQGRRSWRRRAVLSLIPAVALLLAGCGGGGGSAAPNTAETQDFVIGIGVEPNSLDPHTTRAGGDEYYISNVFERLLARDQDGKLVPALAESWQIALPSEHGEDEVKVVVVLVDGAEVTPRELFEYCVDTMPRFMVPKYLELVAELPRTETGKTQKVKLRAAGVTEGTYDRAELGLGKVPVR